MSDRVCYDCEHCSVDYERDYSELTPGAGLTMSCDRNHWYIQGKDATRTALRSALVQARTCPDFTEAKR